MSILRSTCLGGINDLFRSENVTFYTFRSCPNISPLPSYFGKACTYPLCLIPLSWPLFCLFFSHVCTIFSFCSCHPGWSFDAVPCRVCWLVVDDFCEEYPESTFSLPNSTASPDLLLGHLWSVKTIYTRSSIGASVDFGEGTPRNQQQKQDTSGLSHHPKWGKTEFHKSPLTISIVQ